MRGVKGRGGKGLVIYGVKTGILRPMPTPEDKAREQIDKALESAGWHVQDYKHANVHAGRGIALRNFPLASGYGFADYLLYIDGKAAGVIEDSLFDRHHRSFVWSLVGRKSATDITRGPEGSY